MQRKQVIFVADSPDNAHKFQQVLSSLDVDVAAGSSAQFKKLPGRHPACDLVVYEARGGASEDVAGIEALLLEDGTASLLVIVGEGQPARAEQPAGEERLRDAKRLARGVRGAHPPAAMARQRGRHVRPSCCENHDGEPGNLPGHRAGEPLDLTYPQCAAGLPRHPLARTSETRRCAAWGFIEPLRRSRERWTPTCPPHPR